MHRHLARFFPAPVFFLFGVAFSVAAATDAETTLAPIPPGIMAVFDGNETLERHGLEFAVTNRGEGTIELKLVKGNWRVREELNEGKLSVGDLSAEFKVSIDEERIYAEIRGVLNQIVNEVSEVSGVRKVVLSATLETEEDKLAWAEFRAGLKRYEAGQYTDAIPYFQRASALGFPRALRTLGYIFENGQGVERDVEQGRAWYGKAAEQGEAEAFYNLGRVASGQKEFGRALAYYEKAIERKPDLSMAYNNIGYLLNELRHYEKAMPFLRRAIELNPDYAGSYSNLGISLDNLGKHDEAIEVYREALALNPQAADVRVNLGVTLMHKESFDDAITEFHKAIHLQPNWHQPYTGLGSIYFNRKQYDLAVTAYERLVKNRPDHPWGFKLLAETYAQKGEYEKASEAAAQALELAKVTPNYDVETTRRIEAEYRAYVAAGAPNKG